MTGGTCDPGTQYPVPSGGAEAFYTTWSFYGIFAALALLLIYCCIVFIPKIKGSKALRYSFLPVIGAFTINSMSVGLVSQILFAYNFKLAGPNATKGTKSLKTNFFEKMMGVNFKFHITPMVLAIFMMIALLLVHRATGSVWMNPWLLIGLTVLWQVGFVMTYSSVPVKDANTGKCLYGYQKLQNVYNNPPGWIWAVMAGSSLVLSGAFGALLR
jgi:hypothetical protein